MTLTLMLSLQNLGCFAGRVLFRTFLKYGRYVVVSNLDSKMSIVQHPYGRHFVLPEIGKHLLPNHTGLDTDERSHEQVGGALQPILTGHGKRRKKGESETENKTQRGPCPELVALTRDLIEASSSSVHTLYWMLRLCGPVSPSL